MEEREGGREEGNSIEKKEGEEKNKREGNKEGKKGKKKGKGEVVLWRKRGREEKAVGGEEGEGKTPQSSVQEGRWLPSVSFLPSSGSHWSQQCPGYRGHEP